MARIPYRSILYVLAAAMLGALCIIFFSGFRYQEAPWMQDRGTMLVSGGLAVAYIVALILTRLPLLPAQGVFGRILRPICFGAITCLAVLTLMHLADVEVQKLTLLVELALVLFLLLLHGTGIHCAIALGINLVILAVAAYPSFSPSSRAALDRVLAPASDTAPPSTFLMGALHDLEITETKLPIPNPPGAVNAGGAFKQIGPNRLLLVDGNGAFFELTQTGGGIDTKPLNQLSAPMNRAAFLQQAATTSTFFRVMDLLLVDDGRPDKRTAYVAHHQWDEQKQCTRLLVSQTELNLTTLNEAATWQTIYRTQPCLGGDQEIVNETGGRLGQFGDSILLTVGTTLGDAAFLRLSTENPEQSYGKTIRIDRNSGITDTFTSGHRNAQGLLVEDNRIWSTEHGPAGGDELNLLVEAGDYGWPRSSYGTDYGSKMFFDSPTSGDHDVGIRPVYAWLPSIGISRLIRVQGTEFPLWAGDLLIASLRGSGNGYSLFRMRFRDDRVQTVERLRTGRAVRDLTEMPGGEILTWDGKDVIQTLKPAVHVFAQCSACHAVNPLWPRNGIGPDLWNIIGKDVATVEGYDYSPAMKAMGGRWTRERLDYFLQDPQAAVPGTKMQIPGIEDAEMRQKVIQYLIDASRD